MTFCFIIHRSWNNLVTAATIYRSPDALSLYLGNSLNGFRFLEMFCKSVFYPCLWGDCDVLCIITCFFFPQALELNQTNTKALFRRAQAWQGLKEFNKAMVPTLHGHNYTFISLLNQWFPNFFSQTNSAAHPRPQISEMYLNSCSRFLRIQPKDNC